MQEQINKIIGWIVHLLVKNQVFCSLFIRLFLFDIKIDDNNVVSVEKIMHQNELWSQMGGCHLFEQKFDSAEN